MNDLSNNNQGITDYTKMTNDQLYDQFKTENWNSIPSNNDKLNLLQELENRHALAMQREPALVKWETENSTDLGSFCADTNTITIKNCENQYEILDSIVHEQEHAVQFFSPDSLSKITLKDRSLINLENYLSEDGRTSHYCYYGILLYDLMTSELASNSKALTFMASQQERYKNDPFYLAYLKERQDYFKEVSEKIEQLQQIKKDALKTTIYCNKEFSLEEKIYLTNYLDKSRYTDSYELKTKEINEVLQNISIDIENNKLVYLPNQRNQIIYTPPNDKYFDFANPNIKIEKNDVNLNNSNEIVNEHLPSEENIFFTTENNDLQNGNMENNEESSIVVNTLETLHESELENCSTMVSNLELTNSIECNDQPTLVSDLNDSLEESCDPNYSVEADCGMDIS